MSEHPFRPLYLRPDRDMTIEATIVAACARRGVGVSAHAIAAFVRRFWVWASVGEVYRTIERMIRAGRIVERRESGRAHPFYELSESWPGSSD